MKDKQTLNWLLCRAKGQLWQIVLLAVLRCSLTVLGVTFALTSRYVIDAAVAKDIAELTNSAIRLFAIIAAQIGIKLLGQSIEVSVTAKLNINLRSHLFASILKSDYSAQAAYHSGDLLTRLSNDTSIISGGIISLVPSVLALCVGLVYALYSLMRLDMSFAVILLVGGILLLIAISAFRSVMKKLHKRVQETEGVVRSFQSLFQ